MRYRILLVDLNNFGHYPTLSIGYLTAILRQQGHQVDLLSPLAHGMTGVMRESRPKPWSAIDHYTRYRMAVSESSFVRNLYQGAVNLVRGPLTHNQEKFQEVFNQTLSSQQYDAVLVSAYLIYRPLCDLMGQICATQQLPYLIGGPFFSQPEVVQDWLQIDGLAGIVSGEVEPDLPEIIAATVNGEDLSQFTGVWTQDGGLFAPPLKNLDAIPFADYSDFPWDAYKTRLVPMITGRGCKWGACNFCSDVVSSAGRSYRSRSLDNVWSEITHQSNLYNTTSFVFNDLKLNSSLDMWHGLIDRFDREMPTARWLAAVHIGRKQPNGLDADTLQAAHKAGLMRVTTGLESGSQRILDEMRKGTDLESTSQFLHDAHAANISVRTTVIMGYPGETAADLKATIDYIKQHREMIERIHLNRLQIITGTPLHRGLDGQYAYPDVTNLFPNHQMAQIGFQTNIHHDPTYRNMVWQLIRLTQQINRRPLKSTARDFQGVM